MGVFLLSKRKHSMKGREGEGEERRWEGKEEKRRAGGRGGEKRKSPGEGIKLGGNAYTWDPTIKIHKEEQIE